MLEEEDEAIKDDLENDGTVIGRARFRIFNVNKEVKTCVQLRQSQRDVTLLHYSRPVIQSHVGHQRQELSLFAEQVTARDWGACVPTSPRASLTTSDVGAM